jgi:nucleoside-diphosphate-sugar epimerase
MAKFAVFGSEGWIGSALVRHLVSKGHEVYGATRHNWPAAGQNLGNAIFAIGLTGNFRGRPIQCARAHVATLLEVFERYRFESFLYLSSTRVYRGASEGSEEVTLLVRPIDPDDVYNITKLAGESVCLSTNEPRVRVARLSNVFGLGNRTNNFLSSIISDATTSGRVVIQTSRESQRDYVGLADIVFIIESIALTGQARLYNVASGRNVTNNQIAELITRSLGADVRFSENAATITYPRIIIDRIQCEFGFTPLDFEKLFAEMISSIQLNKAAL